VLANKKAAADMRWAGLAAEWEETVRRVRAGRYCKTGFMSGFEAVATSSGPKKQPSFPERAKARWGDRRREHS
jgi:hypothetical protein